MTRQEKIKLKQDIEEINFSIYASLKGITKYKFTGLEDKVDVVFLSGVTVFLAESKVRKDNVDYFLKYGPYLEYKKVDNMFKEQDRLEKEKSKKYPMLYLCFCSDGLIIYNIKEPHNYNFTWRNLPKDNINPEIKIWKLVSELFNPLEIVYYEKENKVN